MRHLLPKFIALACVFGVLVVLIMYIRTMVWERQSYRDQAVASVVQGVAGEQTVLGPLLSQQCTERWSEQNSDKKAIAKDTSFTQITAPATLVMEQAQVDLTPLRRGIFSANTFALSAKLNAQWPALPATPAPRHEGGTVTCNTPRVVLAVGDARGIRSATVQLNGHTLAVQPGTNLPRFSHGLQAELTPALRTATQPLQGEVTIELAGTGALSLVPLADDNRFDLGSNWQHPAFAGRFLPVARNVGAKGFAAQWQVSSLASTAFAALAGGGRICPASSEGHAYTASTSAQPEAQVAEDPAIAAVAAAEAAAAAAKDAADNARAGAVGTAVPAASGEALPALQATAGEAASAAVAPKVKTARLLTQDDGGCIDTLDVRFIDPVNTYSLSDRATKYGLLFVVLTFVAVGIFEVLQQLRVHPVQYLLVGSALSIFFLLLLALSEHIAFGLAYAIAASACVILLTYYASHILKGWARGLPFGAGIALLYGLLYVLLQLEQTALLAGSLALFAVLAVVMVLTRRIDWYSQLGSEMAWRRRGADQPEVAAATARAPLWDDN